MGKSLGFAFVFSLVSMLACAQDLQKGCFEALATERKLQTIFKKIPLDISKGQSLEVLGNTQKPTPNEKPAISLMVSEAEKCLDYGAEYRSKNFPPEVNQIFVEHRQSLVAAFSDLYAGKISFGDLAKFRAKALMDLNYRATTAVRDFKEKQEAIEKQRQAEIANKQQAEIQAKERRQQADRQDQERREAIERQEIARREAQRERESALATQFLLNQRPPLTYEPTPMYRPPVTNCNIFGNNMSCTTN